MDKFFQCTTMSGVGAITRAPMGILLRQLETRQMLEQVALKSTDINAYNISLPKDIVKQKLQHYYSLPPIS